jgi:uncharacterized protein YukE
MTIEYYENEILDLSKTFHEARKIKDEFKREAKMEFLGAVLRMLETSIETSRILRDYKSQIKERSAV